VPQGARKTLGRERAQQQHPALVERTEKLQGDLRRRLLRVILDTKLRLSPDARIVETTDDDLVVFTGESLKSPKARKLQNAGVELISMKLCTGKMDLNTVLKELGKREILSVLLEAGPRLNGAALGAGLVRKIVLFYAPKLAGRSGVPFLLGAEATLPPLHIRAIRQIGPDVAVEAYLHNS
jgi:diaminohydroxyphosphoribosylaminopyrimidine deaminase/5-amino-6-(5-phosphoribosylamino)uracil reductase